MSATANQLLLPVSQPVNSGNKTSAPELKASNAAAFNTGDSDDRNDPGEFSRVLQQKIDEADHSGQNLPDTEKLPEALPADSQNLPPVVSDTPEETSQQSAQALTGSQPPVEPHPAESLSGSPAGEPSEGAAADQQTAAAEKLTVAVTAPSSPVEQTQAEITLSAEVAAQAAKADTAVPVGSALAADAEGPTTVLAGDSLQPAAAKAAGAADQSAELKPGNSPVQSEPAAQSAAQDKSGATLLTASEYRDGPKNVPASAETAAPAAGTVEQEAGLAARAQGDGQQTADKAGVGGTDTVAASSTPVSEIRKTAEQVNQAVVLQQAPATSMSAALAFEAASFSVQMKQTTTEPGKLQKFADLIGATASGASLSSVQGSGSELLASGSQTAGNSTATPQPAMPGAENVADQPGGQHRHDSGSAQQALRQQNAQPGLQGQLANSNQQFQSSFSTSFGEPGWGEEMTKHISLLAAQKSGSAQIQLDPPELGSLMVRIHVSGDQASINFMSPHLQVRDALEQNMDRLQSLLGEQGLDLVDVDVSDQRQQESGQNHGGNARMAGGDQDALTAAELAGGTQVLRQLGLVDYYA